MQGLDLASYLVMYYPSFCEQFLEFGGVTLIINRGLLMCRKASLLLRTMEVVSHLTRISKAYYPLVQKVNPCQAMSRILRNPDPHVRAEACKLVGNLSRHSDFFYKDFQQTKICMQLVPLCHDRDDNVRKWAAFAVGNAAFHSGLLYGELADAVPMLHVRFRMQNF